MQNELDLQREVSQQFAPVAAQTVAWTADKLGNIQNYERVRIAKANLQEQLKDAQNPEQIAQLQQQLALADQYLSDHQTEYNTWKEGGLGRAALHAGVGALLTGDAQGAVGAGTSSLAAPYLNQVGDKFGGAGKLLTDTLGGAAIGALTGGSTGAAVAGANADWFNRQLHPDETRKLNELSKGKSESEQYRLKAAACALVHCAEGIPTSDPYYQGLKELQEAGNAFHREKRMLRANGLSEPRPWFQYSIWDKVNDTRTSFDRAITKAQGATNIAAGSAVAAGSLVAVPVACVESVGFACPAAAAVGAYGFKAGYEQNQYGTQQLFSKYQSEFGKKVITSLGEPIEYESQLASDAKNLALWGLETLITRKLFGGAGKNQHTNTSSKQPTNHEVNTPAAKRDVNGRLHSTENGRFLSETNKFTTNLERRSLRADTKRKIEANYTRLSDGSYIDNRTLKIIKPPVHYGHEYGWEHRRLVRAAEELGMNQKQFDDYVNARPQHFRLENSADNQSHKFEKPGNDDLGDIKKDMINFLNGGK